MKNTLFALVALLLVILFFGCTQNSKEDYLWVKDIVIKREIISNISNDDGSANARFILENRSNHTLKNNWKLLYSEIPRRLLPHKYSQPCTVEQINGDWHRLVPVDTFSLKSGETIDIFYHPHSFITKECSGPAGAYFVFYDDMGNEKKIIEVDCEILPFVRPEQQKRIRNDLVPVPTPQIRYKENMGLSVLPENKLLKIIPSPVEVKSHNKTTVIDSSWTVVYDKGLNNEMKFVVEKMRTSFGLNIHLSDKPVKGKTIVLKLADVVVAGKSSEAYTLEVKDNNVTIAGGNAAGVFYGIQSLLALAPLDSYKKGNGSVRIEQVEVKDAPRFGYRALHIDIARNFKVKNEILKMIDVISFYKLNKLFLYLADDEGWRLEIPGLPELTEVGAVRKHTKDVKNAVLPPAYGSGPFPYKKGSQGSGYLTKNDFIEILKYANDRHIEVIPGIDMPGHAHAAIKSMEARFNKYNAENNKEKANEYRLIDPADKSVYRSAQGYSDNVVSIVNKPVYRFIDKVFGEIASMYSEAGLEMRDIHVGGDEVPKGAWTDYPAAARLLKEHPEYKEVKDLQAYFFKKLLHEVEKYNCNVLGWEEVVLLKNEKGGYDINPEFIGKKVIPQVWNNIYEYGNMDLTYRIANAGYDLIMSPASNFYLDLAYNRDPKEPGATWAGSLNCKGTWSFAPFDMYKLVSHTTYGHKINPENLNGLIRLRPEAKSHIKGVQAQLWSESITSDSLLEYFAFPKIFGYFESAWAKERAWESVEDRSQRYTIIDKEWNVFANSLAQKELPRLSYIDGGFVYRIPLPGAIVEDGKLYANIAFPGLELRYTTDGTDPDINSQKYEGGVKVTGNVKIRAFDASGKSSRVVDVIYR